MVALGERDRLRPRHLPRHQLPAHPLPAQPPEGRLRRQVAHPARQRPDGQLRGLGRQDRLERVPHDHLDRRPARQIPPGVPDQDLGRARDHLRGAHQDGRQRRGLRFRGDASHSGGATQPSGTRRITTDGRLVYDGGTYLLPWEPRRATDPDKLYHYNPQGGSTRWDLPRGWSGSRAVYAYRLTDQGRTQETATSPSAAAASPSTAEPGVAYVLHRTRAPAQRRPRLGRGHPAAPTPASTPATWTAGRSPARPPSGSASAATTNWSSARAAPPPSPSDSPASPPATTPPRYRSRSARRRGSGARAAPGGPYRRRRHRRQLDRHLHRRQLRRRRPQAGTRFQRMFTPFTVPEGGGPVTLTLDRGGRPGPGRLRQRPRRRRRAAPPSTGTLAYEDFEHVPQGWGVFVKGDAGGITDPRTHIAQRHAPVHPARLERQGGRRRPRRRRSRSSHAARTAAWSTAPSRTPSASPRAAATGSPSATRTRRPASTPGSPPSTHPRPAN